MTEILVELILGLAIGALICSLSLGLVLNYRGAGVVNVGLGAVATLGAFLFYSLNVKGVLLFRGLSIGGPMAKVPALVITLLICAALGVLWDIIVLRPLRRAPPIAKLVASLGLLLALQAALVLEFGNTGQVAPSVLPNVGTISVGGQPLPANELVVAGIVVLVAVALAAVYRWTRFGLCTRAASENEQAAMLNGLSPDRLSMINTTMAFVLAALLGVLVAPMASLDPVTMTVAIVPALAAALLARFTSFTIAAAAGLVMGAIQALVTYAQTKSWFPTSGGVALPGTSDLIYLLIVAAVICGVGKSLPVRGTLAESRLPAAPAARRVIKPTMILLVLGAAAVIFLPFSLRSGMITSLIGALVCLSIVVTTGFVGQISLAQIALAGVSAFAITKLAAHTGLGFPIVPLIGALAATGFGLVVGLPALRVRGVNLAVMTMAAAVAIENFGFQNATWGAGPSGSPVPEPTLFGLDIGPKAGFSLGPGKIPSPVFGLVCLIVLAAIACFVVLLRRSSLGHQMLAVRSNERAAAAAGIRVRDVKLVAFALSSFIAGLAGALYAYQLGAVTTASFDIFVSFGFIAFAYIGGITTVSGALIGGVLVADGLGITVIQKVTGLPSNWALLFGGVALVVTVIANPAGIAGATREQIASLRARRGWGRGSEPPLTPAVVVPPAAAVPQAAIGRSSAGPVEAERR
jgi:branched-chain amino acid transport system permease protein